MAKLCLLRKVGGAARIAAIYLVAISTTAQAADFCVTCAGPEAHYACAFDGVAAGAEDPRLKLLCITELAKAGGHATCSVDRKQLTPCPGETKKLAMPDGMDLDTEAGATPAQAADPTGATKAVTPATDAKATKPETVVPKTAGPSVAPATPLSPAAAKPEAPPKTVEEMVEKGSASTEKALQDGGEAVEGAAKSTGNFLQKAGKAVGDAAKKSWNCITSLFGNC